MTQPTEMLLEDIKAWYFWTWRCGSTDRVLFNFSCLYGLPYCCWYFFPYYHGWFAEVGHIHRGRHNIVRDHYLWEYAFFITSALSKTKVGLAWHTCSVFFDLNSGYLNISDKRIPC